MYSDSMALISASSSSTEGDGSLAGREAWEANLQVSGHMPKTTGSEKPIRGVAGRELKQPRLQ